MISARQRPMSVSPGQETGEASSLSGYTVVVDPGHPSERNSGKAVQNGTTEVHICWIVAQKVRAILEGWGATVVMTKLREGQFVTNRDRAAVANRQHADLFLRLHCDVNPGSGFAVYYPDRPGISQGKKGPSRSVIDASGEAARLFHAGFARQFRRHLRDNGIRGDSATYVGSRQGALTGSIFSTVPTLTVEMCVLRNARDAAFAKTEEGRDRLSLALAMGVKAYIVGRARSAWR